jgi:hypothetical protein
LASALPAHRKLRRNLFTCFNAFLLKLSTMSWCSGIIATNSNKEILRKQTLCPVKPGDSHFWQGLIKIKHILGKCVKIKLGDGYKISFWEDH